MDMALMLALKLIPTIANAVKLGLDVTAVINRTNDIIVAGTVPTDDDWAVLDAELKRLSAELNTDPPPS